MVELLIISIHGMGMQDLKYYTEFEKKLSDQLTKHNLTEGEEYVFKGFHYASVFEEEANIVFDMGKDLDWQSLRRFVVNFLGDALAYQKGVSDPNRINYYDIINDKLDTDLNNWVKNLPISDKTPVLIFAHSLGAYIISNYIWDKQKVAPESPRLQDMGSLAGIVTFGCNIPILTIGFESSKLYPITLPGAGISDGDHIKWLNIYDRDDVLSLPLENFYSSRNEDEKRSIEKIRDIEMNIGNLLINWNPYSHKGYWNDKGFIKSVSEYINELISGLRSH